LAIATKVATKYNCTCGFGTNSPIAISGHLRKKDGAVHQLLDIPVAEVKAPNPNNPVKVAVCPDCDGDVYLNPSTSVYMCISCTNAWDKEGKRIIASTTMPVLEKKIELKPRSKGLFSFGNKKEKVKVENKIIGQTPAPTEASPQVEVARENPTGQLTWKRTPIEVSGKKHKAEVKTACIVIDSKNQWHQDEMIALGDRDVADCKWGYYGKRYPVLIEKGGYLIPYIPKDDVGIESPHRLFIAAKSAAYKMYMRIDSDLLKKIQIGLMALLAIGVLFLIYILVNQEPPANSEVSAITTVVGGLI